jgi:D-alanine-D-alanine ligase
MGGTGSEREISLQSGNAVAHALSQAGIDHVTSDVSPDTLEILADPSVTLFFLALHGEFGEDGQLQRILEERGLCYAGSGPEASALAFDKLASKSVLARQGVPCPRAIEFTEDLDATELETRLQSFAGKIVVKPPRAGSSCGVQIVPRTADLWTLGRQTLRDHGDCMIEEFIGGRELTVSILDERALPVIEIKPVRPFYDYQAKYVDEGTQYLFDTLLEAEAHALQQQALRCFAGLGLRHFGRIDFILAPDGVAYCLEANSIPGLTSHSLLPKAAQKAGYCMSDLCCAIVDAARCKRTS